jgi:alkanesulfonate monooxygenase SsuD/methylene tetrahydromethanopterin reductase-like flavin-dependent oxidoreductase (luciferase family)
MDEMTIGLFNLATWRDPALPVENVITGVVEQVEKADAFGFDVAWFAEHHFSNLCVCPSPLLIASHCAGRTRRIRLGAAVLVLPFYNPMRLIDEITYVDILSGGRLMLGVGTGNQGYEADRLGISMADARVRFIEALDVIEQSFTGGPVGYAGATINVPSALLPLRSSGRAPLPIYLAGLTRDPEMMKRCAERDYVPFVSGPLMSTEQIAAMRDVYVTAYAAAGKSPDLMPFALQRSIYVTDDRSDALDAAERLRYVQRVIHALHHPGPAFDGFHVRESPLANEDTVEALVDKAIIGSAEHCIERLLKDIRVLQPTHLSCTLQFGGLPQAKVLTSMERFATEVMPHVRAAGTSAMARRHGRLSASAA